MSLMRELLDIKFTNRNEDAIQRQIINYMNHNFKNDKMNHHDVSNK